MNILKNEYSKIVLGILWGIGLACIFRCACNGRKCIIFKAPKPADIKGKIYNHDEKCYEYESISTKCTEDAVEI
jgi:hypothetical protein